MLIYLVDNYNEKHFPNAVKYGNSNISLPIHSKISQDDVIYVCETIKTLCEST